MKFFLLENMKSGLFGVCTAIMIVALGFQLGCSPTSTTTTEPEHEIFFEEIHPEVHRVPSVATDWVLLEGEPRFLRPRTWNLHHQAARLSFDFEQQAVIGSTELLFTSIRNNNQILILDSKTTDFHSITLTSSGEELAIRQDSATVSILLDRSYSRDDTLSVTIDFTSFPPRRGLYFVDPLGKDPSKPTQIWTLGQPEDNSFWLPTIDHPAERTTQEFWLTVPDSMTTLSNGFLISSSSDPANNLRTDYWRLDLPHTPYLFALAVGVFDVTDRWVNDIYYAYYTEPKYAAYKDDIYAHTEDIMDYFNDRFDYPYPWGSYAQVPVHEFIARGMENTSATILYNLVQFDCRGARDLNNTALIVHELVHQWFGNLVTCKDWANLPFNEGFANYFETLYKIDRIDENAGRWHSLNHKADYFTEATRYRRPIIFNQYSEPEDMYDRHTYAKAGQVLGMLHHYVGDEVWWSALQLFLREHEYSAVDMHDVRRAFEQESGLSLSWFFDQWFFEPGHPDLSISWAVHEGSDSDTLEISINQIHDITRQPVYRLESIAEVRFSDGNTMSIPVRISEIENVIRMPVSENIADVIFDPQSVQLAVLHEDLSDEQLIGRLQHHEIATRYNALHYVKGNRIGTDFTENLRLVVRDDDSPEIRGLAMEILRQERTQENAQFALSINSENEAYFRVHTEVIQLLEHFPQLEGVQNHLQKALHDSSYFIAAQAIVSYMRAGFEDAEELIIPFAESYSWNHLLRNAVADAMLISGTPESFRTMLKLAAMPGNASFRSKALSYVASSAPRYQMTDESLSLMIEVLNDPYPENRLHAIRAIRSYGNEEAINALRELRERTDNEDEIRILNNVFSD
ncbi:MAG: M1 family metallopeptidase [Balneolales bacterium]|nr:M1 family metallopeptidase [Balneolales bacterium]